MTHPRLEVYLCLFPDMECSLVLLGSFLPCKKHQWSRKAWNNVWKAWESGRKEGSDYERKGGWEGQMQESKKEGRNKILAVSQFSCFPSFSSTWKEAVPVHLSLVHRCSTPSPSPRALLRLRACPLAQKHQRGEAVLESLGHFSLFDSITEKWQSLYAPPVPLQKGGWNDSPGASTEFILKQTTYFCSYSHTSLKKKQYRTKKETCLFTQCINFDFWIFKFSFHSLWPCILLEGLFFSDSRTNPSPLVLIEIWALHFSQINCASSSRRYSKYFYVFRMWGWYL